MMNPDDFRGNIEHKVRVLRNVTIENINGTVSGNISDIKYANQHAITILVKCLFRFVSDRNPPPGYGGEKLEKVAVIRDAFLGFDFNRLPPRFTQLIHQVINGESYDIGQELYVWAFAREITGPRQWMMVVQDPQYNIKLTVVMLNAVGYNVRAIHN